MEEDRVRVEAAIPYPKVGSALSMCIGLPNCYRCKIYVEFRTSVIHSYSFLPIYVIYIVILFLRVACDNLGP